MPPEADPAAATGAAAPAAKKGPSTGSVTEELTVDKADSTPDNPRAGSVANHLAASFNLGEEWALDFAFDYTASQGAPAPAGQAFADRGGKATSFSAGADWDPNDHLSLGAALSFAPKAASVSGTTLQFDTSGGKTTTLDAQLRADSSTAGLGLNASYDTAGDSDLEWTFSLGLAASHLDTIQQVTALQRQDGVTISKKGLSDYCTANTKKCPKTLRDALKEQDYQLDSLQLSVGVLATLFEDTDVGVTVDGWVYSQDPTEVGYFTLTGPKSTFSGGGGVPVAPMREDLRVALTQRFGAFSVRLNGSVGGYVADTGGGTYSGGAKLQYKFSKAFRLWLTLSARHDVDSSGNDSVSRSGSLGASLRF